MKQRGKARVSILGQQLLKLDKFGSGVNFNIQGQDQYQTGVGAIASFFIYLTVVIYGAQKVTKLVERSDTTFQRSVEEIDFSENRTYSFKELELNIGFGILNTNYMPAIYSLKQLIFHSFNYMPAVDYDQYVTIEASQFSGYTGENNFPKYTYDPIETKPCDAFDKFDKPSKFLEPVWLTYLPSMTCFRDPDQIKVRGRYFSSSNTLLSVQVKKCQGKHCKSDDEIDQWVSDHPYLVILHNNMIYHPEEYGENVIVKETYPAVAYLNSKDSKLALYSVQTQSIESEQDWIGHGLSQKSYTFNTLVKDEPVFDAQKSLGGFIVEIAKDRINNQRSIYSVLDFLGDVGGLYSILLDIGGILVCAITGLMGCTIDKFLEQRVFQQGNKAESNPEQETMQGQVEAKAKNQISLDKSGKAERNRSKIAQTRLTKQLDVLTFMKKQITLDVMLRTIFTKTERYLVRKNKRFQLQPESSSSDEARPTCFDVQSRYFQQLFEGTDQQDRENSMSSINSNINEDSVIEFQDQSRMDRNLFTEKKEREPF